MADRQYCTEASVTKALPAGYNDTLDSAAVVAIIREVGEDVDGALLDYWPFPVFNATPPTPKLVARATRLKAIAECNRQLGMYDLFDDLRPPAELEKQADDMLAPYARGTSIANIIISKRIPPELIANETIDWGPPGTALNTNEHQFAKVNAEVLPATVEIAGYENGVDFDIYYAPKYNRWILRQLNNDITEGADNDKVTYQISYLRQRHDVPLLGPKVIDILLG